MITKKHITKIDSISHIRKKHSDSLISEIDNTRQLLHEKFGMSRLIGVAPSFIAVLKKVLAIATNDESVLLCGEVGTEKELFAQAIHYLSRRKDRPFLAMNCSAIPAELFESELFGHGQGTYVDSQKPQEGYIAQAKGGTLFLNEVDSISNKAQDRLFLLLQEKKYQPNGNSKFENADIRIIAASNINLLHPKANGYFRKDLLYKLDKFSLTIPPLRCRRSDIPLLANFFVEKYTELYKLKQKTFSDTALQN